MPVARAIRAGSPQRLVVEDIAAASDHGVNQSRAVPGGVVIIGKRRPRALVLVLTLALAMLTLAVQPVDATLLLLKPSPTDPATFSGKGGYSADGLGQNVTGGTVQAQVPAGSTVVQAYLYGTYFGASGGPAPALADRTLDFDGTNVVLQTLPNSEPSTYSLYTARADVTAQVATKVGSGGATTDFAVNTDPASLDGVALVAIFSNAALPDVTIAVLDGGSKPAGDQVVFNFAGPIDPTAPGFSAILSLGSGFSFQNGSGNPHDCGTVQYSIVNVNSQALTACAGNWDDGYNANGGLITVGGVGDATDNPANPTAQNTGTDDELYNLVPFMSTGQTQLVINTQNPSADDNLFLAIVQVTAPATVTTNSADVAITNFADSPDPVTATKPIRYTTDLTNFGPDPATNVSVTQVLPPGSTFLGASDPSCAESEGQVSCNLGTLAAEGSTTLTIDVAAPSTAGSVVSSVSVSADEPDPNSENNSDSETTTVQNPSAAPDDGSGFATGQGATTISTSSSDPVQFSRITVPAGVVGEVVMHEETESVCSLVVVGVRCIGERLDLDAPSTTANNPLVLEIFVGKAAAGKINPKKPPVLYHAADAINYLPVPPCVKKTHVANPAPSCVAPIKNVTIGGIAFFQFTVYTMTNGSWRPGSPR